jgi:serine/threonine protein kinase
MSNHSRSVTPVRQLTSVGISPNGTAAAPAAPAAAANVTSQSVMPAETGRQQAIGGQYFLGGTLGKSLFGVVFQGLNSNNGEIVAIKQIPVEDLDAEKLKNIQEIERFKKLEHPNIVRIYDAIPNDQFLYLVLEMVEGGSVIMLKESVNLPESLIAKYISKCLKGLSYLHKKNIVHNDIKGVNILVARDGTVKLADCVQPKLKRKDDAAGIGQPYWMAPEVIKNNEETPKSDVWSLGCTVIELFTGMPPYGNFASMAAVLQIMKDEPPPLPEGISPELKEFLQCCLEKNPQKRSTVEQLQELPWIKNVRNTEEEEEQEKQANHDSEERDREEQGNLESTDSKLQANSSDSVNPNKKRTKTEGETEEGENQNKEQKDEEHLTLKVHLSDLTDIKPIPVSSVMLFVFQDTHAAAMVDVALKKAGLNVESTQYCLVEIDNVTGEERRFNDYDLPRLEAEVLWQFDGEIRFSIKKKGALVKEGYLQKKQKKNWTNFYCVLDSIERYFACYAEKPSNRDEVLANYVVYSFHLIKWVFINDDEDNSFIIRYINGDEDVFRTKTEEDMISWINEIRFACDIHFLFDEI